MFETRAGMLCSLSRTCCWSCISAWGGIVGMFLIFQPPPERWKLQTEIFAGKGVRALRCGWSWTVCDAKIVHQPFTWKKMIGKINPLWFIFFAELCNKFNGKISMELTVKYVRVIVESRGSLWEMWVILSNLSFPNLKALRQPLAPCFICLAGEYLSTRQSSLEANSLC